MQINLDKEFNLKTPEALLRGVNIELIYRVERILRIEIDKSNYSLFIDTLMEVDEIAEKSSSY